MKQCRRNIVIMINICLVFAILFWAWQPKAAAAPAADFYKDKRMLFMVPSTAGGGTDLIARLLSPYLKKYMGLYAVIIENVPQAGGMLAFNRLWSSKPDGLTLIVQPPPSSVMMEANKEEGVRFQCDKFNIVFAASSNIGFVLVVNAKGPYKSVDDLRKAKGLKCATLFGKAPTASYFADVLGLDARITPGMSTGDSRLALMRGEIDYVPEELVGVLEGIETGAMRPLCIDISGPLTTLPQVPSVTKLVSLTPQQKEWSRIFDVTDSGKYIFAGPNVPKERVEYLRNVFERIHKDPQFLTDRKKFEKFPGSLPWANGVQAQKTYTTYLTLAKGKGYSQMIEYLSKKYYTVK